MYDLKDFKEYEPCQGDDPPGPVLVWRIRDGYHFLNSTAEMGQDMKLIGVLK